jgi:hypothetical protein
MRVTVFLLLAVLLAFGASAATAQTTQPGLWFTIANGCTSAVSGFAVGDKLCLLQIGTATFTRGIFQGTMAAGEKKTGMACTGKDGTATVIFVPPVSTPVQAVVVQVKPNQVVSIPKTFCPGVGAAPQDQFKNKP